MKAINKQAGSILDILTRDLGLGEASKIDNSAEAYMAVHVERIGESALGPVYSVAHYFLQNGDLVPDPDVTFLHGSDGRWYPLSFQNALTYQRSAEIRPDGELLVNRARQSDLAQFCNTWMRNVRDQQEIGR